MDDPWGSPWASAPSDTVSKNDHPPSPSSPPKSLLSLPPKAFFGGSLNLPAQSPWAEHGFGDWASPGPVDDTAPNLQWASWAEPGLAPRAESPGKQSPIAWPSSTATSPGLKPMRSRSSTLFRQSSPDPWANDAPWRDRDEVAPFKAVSITSTTDDPEAPLPVDTQVVIHVEEPRAAGTTDEIDSQDKLHVHDAREGGATLSLAVEPEGHESPSRPSSTFSAESSHDQDQQDSPITSVDEELNFRPQNLKRKPSSKVSDLVGLYDGLARAASDGSGSRPVSRKKSTGSTHAANCIEDAGAGEGDNVFDHEPSTLEDSRTSISSGGSSTPRIQPQNRLSQSSHASSDKGHDPAADAHALALRELTEEFGVIKFDVDVKLLGRAFDSKLDPDYEECVAPEGLTDRIITDIFGTVAERKAWYRVSRFGSMRKHDSGDEENYHRVTWQTSQLHDDAIKVVRRWMEEDSISGKPILGGGKRTSAFNWDSAAAPVALDKVFARRSLGARSKGSSSVPMGHTPTSSIGSHISITEEPTFPSGLGGSYASSSIGTPSTSASPIANFGWSTRPPSTSIMTTRSSVHSLQIEKPAQRSAISTTPGLLSPAFQQPQVINEQGSEVPMKSDDDDDDDNDDDAEDDDWGEMVFSPTQEAFTTTENHILSQSTGDEFSRVSVTGTTDAHPVSKGQSAHAQPSTSGSAASEVSASILYRHDPSQNAQWAPKPNTETRTSIDLGQLETSSARVQPSSTVLSFSQCVVEPVSPSASPPSPLSKGTAMDTSMNVPSPSCLNALVSAATISPSPVESSVDAAGNVVIQQILQGLPDLYYMLR